MMMPFASCGRNSRNSLANALLDIAGAIARVQEIWVFSMNFAAARVVAQYSAMSAQNG
jgi:hypothetical protein